jgi:O-acetyl-ADP-ribose deacetylase (regulator of RNase III)
LHLTCLEQKCIIPTTTKEHTMKIEYVKGNLFETDIEYIVHGCNAQGVMGSGVAKIVRDDYFDAYKFYVEQYDEHGLKLGDVQFVPANGKIIVNAITQDNFGRTGHRFVSYEAVAECMRTVNRVVKLSGHTRVAMPQIGAGLGGGNWEIISRIIEDEMIDVQPVVYVL